jgi:4-amino-4-deoxy-L-arabinose transferase-like glycosyltransferase
MRHFLFQTIGAYGLETMRRDPGPQDSIAIGLILLLTAAAFAFPGGFVGSDDLYYHQAAERWVERGPHAPENHWEVWLPYVLAIAACLRLRGSLEVALIVPNALGFAAMLLGIWGIARTVADARVAVWAVFIAGTTPLIFSLPTRYYPESLEGAFLALSAWLVVRAMFAAPAEATRRSLLFCGGLLGALALLTRETALAWPLAASRVKARCSTGNWRSAGKRIVRLICTGRSIRCS